MERLIITGVKAVTPDVVVEDARVVVENGKIASVLAADAPQQTESDGGDEIVDLGGKWLLPGFIDLHVHGGGGGEFTTGETAEYEVAAKYHARHGTTSLFATTITDSPHSLQKAAAGLRTYIERQEADAARILGIHMEGPYLNRARCGAQNVGWIRDPDREELEDLLDAADPYLRLITLAPEQPNAFELIKLARQRGVIVAAGHTDATYKQVAAAVEAGLSHSIHTYNGMRGLHHREPGALGGLLDFDSVTCEVIADGLHVHPAAMRLLYRAKGKERIVLITDAISASGMPDGEYKLGGAPIRVEQGRAELTDGSSLAGSTLTIDRAVRNTVDMLGVSLADAATMASTNPARVVGLEEKKGQVAPGFDADLVVLNQSLEVEATMVGGRFVHSMEDGPRVRENHNHGKEWNFT